MYRQEYPDCHGRNSTCRRATHTRYTKSGLPDGATCPGGVDSRSFGIYRLIGGSGTRQESPFLVWNTRSPVQLRGGPRWFQMVAGWVDLQPAIKFDNGVIDLGGWH